MKRSAKETIKTFNIPIMQVGEANLSPTITKSAKTQRQNTTNIKPKDASPKKPQLFKTKKWKRSL
jgi:hypothetical protein